MIKSSNRNSLPLYCIVFLTVLFISITIGTPAFQYNDEWISANQLHQLGEGHQIVTNEGKYGSFVNNQLTEYFSIRGNILGYSLFLPILALPTYHIFLLLDLNFRLGILLLWSFIPVLISLLVLQYYPEYSKIWKVNWTFILIFMSLIGLLFNLCFFYPFSVSNPTDPIEAAALIFTDHILFALLSIILLFICRLLFKNSCFSLFGVIALLCSSSYIYWGSSAKDHMLTAVIFAGIIATLFLIVKKDDLKYGILTFCGCGLLAWVRPELAFVFTICCLFFYYGYLFRKKSTLSDKRKFAILFLIPLVLLIGSLPFFINNNIITGDPLKPVFIYMESGTVVQDNTAKSVFTDIKSDTVNQDNTIRSNDKSLLPYILTYFSPKWETFCSDLFHVLFNPISGMIGVFAICPLFLLSIGLFILNRIIPVFKKTEGWNLEVLICIASILSVFITYISGLHGLIISEGIGPDMRYLSPLYIPGGLIGLIALYQISELTKNSCNLLKYSIISLVIGSPLIFIGLILYSPYNGSFFGFTKFISYLVYILITIFLLILIINRKISLPKSFLYSTLFLILIMPVVWNLIIVVLFSITRGYGYEFWLPALQWLYDLFLIPVG